MKRIIYLILAIFIVCFSLGSCESSTDNSPKTTSVKYSDDATSSKSSGAIKNDYSEKSKVESSTESIEEPKQTGIDPFDGIKIVMSGISPACKASINNANCSADAQKYVTYSLDKKTYQNGDTVKITAELSRSAKDYYLTKNEFLYTFEEQPELVTSIDGLDLTSLENELKDYISARTAEAVGNWALFDSNGGIGNQYSKFKSVGELSINKSYFVALKPNKLEGRHEFFNSMSYICTISAVKHGGSINGEENVTVYVNISAQNLIKYPDGRISWGSKSETGFDFVSKSKLEGIENLVSTTVTAYSSDYNITEIK